MKNEKILSRLTDFRNFLYITWKHLNLPEPTKIQYDIADYIANGISPIKDFSETTGRLVWDWQINDDTLFYAS